MVGTDTPVLPPPSQNKHERIYTLLLAIFAFFQILGAGTNWVVANSPQFDEISRMTVRATACMLACYSAAAVLTLILRITAPAKARPLTTFLNIVLLVLLPFGTALGIYGLLKLRAPKPRDAAADACS